VHDSVKYCICNGLFTYNFLSNSRK